MKSRSLGLLESKSRRREAVASCRASRHAQRGAAARAAHTPIAARAEIMEAAARVFAERGYHGASTQDIADVLGIRQASLYYYFPSKEVALEQVCMQGVEGFYRDRAGHRGGARNGRAKACRPDPRAYRAAARPQQFREGVPHPAPVPAEREPAPDRQVVARIEADLRERDPAGHRASGEFRADADPRLVTLAILGMSNGCRGLVRQGKGLDRAHRRRVCRTGAAPVWCVKHSTGKRTRSEISMRL